MVGNFIFAIIYLKTNNLQIQKNISLEIICIINVYKKNSNAAIYVF